jgi:hypothetical protein
VPGVQNILSLLHPANNADMVCLVVNVGGRSWLDNLPLVRWGCRSLLVCLYVGIVGIQAEPRSMGARPHGAGSTRNETR